MRSFFPSFLPKQCQVASLSVHYRMLLHIKMKCPVPQILFLSACLLCANGPRCSPRAMYIWLNHQLVGQRRYRNRSFKYSVQSTRLEICTGRPENTPGVVDVQGRLPEGKRPEGICLCDKQALRQGNV